MVGEARVSSGRSRNAAGVIVDAQSVKNTDTAQHKDHDAGKKVSGVKRHIAVDTQGLPHAIAVTTADVTDRKGAFQAFASPRKTLSRVINVLVDGGYTGPPLVAGAREIPGPSVEIGRRGERHAFAVMPKRRRIERSFAWLENVEGFGKTASVRAIPACSLSLGFPRFALAALAEKIKSGIVKKILNGFIAIFCHTSYTRVAIGEFSSYRCGAISTIRSSTVLVGYLHFLDFNLSCVTRWMANAVEQG